MNPASSEFRPVIYSTPLTVSEPEPTRCYWLALDFWVGGYAGRSIILDPFRLVCFARCSKVYLSPICIPVEASKMFLGATTCSPMSSCPARPVQVTLRAGFSFAVLQKLALRKLSGSARTIPAGCILKEHRARNKSDLLGLNSLNFLNTI